MARRGNPLTVQELERMNANQAQSIVQLQEELDAIRNAVSEAADLLPDDDDEEDSEDGDSDDDEED